MTVNVCFLPQLIVFIWFLSLRKPHLWQKVKSGRKTVFIKIIFKTLISNDNLPFLVIHRVNNFMTYLNCLPSTWNVVQNISHLNRNSNFNNFINSNWDDLHLENWAWTQFFFYIPSFEESLTLHVQLQEIVHHFLHHRRIYQPEHHHMILLALVPEWLSDLIA
jgi:hypothetical protein